MVWRMALGHDAERDLLLGDIFLFPYGRGRTPQSTAASIGVATNFADYAVDVRQAVEMLRDVVDGVPGQEFSGRLLPGFSAA